MAQITMDNNLALDKVAKALNLDVEALNANTLVKFTLVIDFQEQSPVVQVEYLPVEK